MTDLIKILQHPLIKIFIAPFALVGIGSIIGIQQSDNPNWVSALLLFVIAIDTQLVDHYFHQKHIQRNSTNTPEIVLYVCEAVLILATVAFILTNNWVVNILLLSFIAFVHLQYLPYIFVNTFYQYLLQLFYYGFALNCIAFYAQTNTITTNYLLTLIPFVLLTAGLTIEVNGLKYMVMTRRPLSALYHWTGVALALASVFAGFYFALPSHSFFIVQVLYLLLVGVTLIPVLVPVNNDKKRQNKINYLSAILVVFTILYSLAVIF